eukprot:TRINITY_DN27161_c0_g1_i1.p2 TRINITY_DN27161_c0_g1~~TRINITY_DN27161_c0_g1_i1.p2  ORF type:complete len:106 (-),score=5.17 TRINITY_DN27161_c0_g1_i1:246-563(-)
MLSAMYKVLLMHVQPGLGTESGQPKDMVEDSSEKGQVEETSTLLHPPAQLTRGLMHVLLQVLSSLQLMLQFAEFETHPKLAFLQVSGSKQFNVHLADPAQVKRKP